MFSEIKQIVYCWRHTVITIVTCFYVCTKSLIQIPSDENPVHLLGKFLSWICVTFVFCNHSVFLWKWEKVFIYSLYLLNKKQSVWNCQLCRRPADMLAVCVPDWLSVLRGGPSTYAKCSHAAKGDGVPVCPLQHDPKNQHQWFCRHW